MTVKCQIKKCTRASTQGWVSNWVTITTDTCGLSRILPDLFPQAHPDRPLIIDAYYYALHPRGHWFEPSTAHCPTVRASKVLHHLTGSN